MFEGKPRKRADGRWELQITIGVDQSGKRIRKSFYGHKQKEVSDKKDAWLREYQHHQNSQQDGNSIPFCDWADRWLRSKKTKVRPYTYKYTYEARVEKYLKPYFGTKPIDNIIQLDIQDFFDMHIDLSLATQQTLKTILNSMFAIAVINDFCSKNPVVKINLNTQYTSKEKQFFNKEQQRVAIDWAIENEQYDVLTILKTGIRRGELLGLKWSDIDFENKVVSVTESRCDGIDGEAPDMRVKSKSSKRKIPVDDELLEYLNKVEHKSDYVFPYITAKAYGTHICRVLKRMAQDCGLPYLSPHELRHTYGTVMRENGVDIYTISKVMGHADIKVTSDTYVHNDLAVLRKAMNME